MEKRKVPALRFKDFTQDWEQRKLQKWVGATYGGGTPATANNEFWDGDIPWIQSSNVVEGELFDVDVKKYLSKNGVMHSAAQLIPENSVAVVTHVGVGKLVFMSYSYTTSQDFISLSDLKCVPKFLCYTLYKKLQEDLHVVQGSAIKGITKEDLMSKQIFLPDIDEQRRIAGALLSLDHFITLHQRKLEKLKKIKKSMLEKMFPKNNEKIPEIRFSAFFNDWEQRKLGECFSERIETMPDGELISVTINDGVKKFSELGRFDNSNPDKSKYKKVCSDDIAYNSMRMWQGASGYSPYTGIVSPAYTVLIPNECVNSKFVSYLFKRDDILNVNCKSKLNIFLIKKYYQ